MPDDVRRSVSADEARVYDLIWKRTVASQMVGAVGRTVSVRLGATASRRKTSSSRRAAPCSPSPGFRRAYVEGADDPEAELADQERPLPDLAPGDALDVVELVAKDHATSAPARYTEASLVKRLEELGVGRPSTYASIIDTITNRRGYARKRGSALIPTFTAFAVTGLLEDHFDQLVDYGLTASMEDDLDRIAGGEAERIPWLHRFYFGNGQAGLRELVSEQRLAGIDPAEVNTIPIGVDGDGAPDRRTLRPVRPLRQARRRHRVGARRTRARRGHRRESPRTAGRAERRSRARHRPGDRLAVVARTGRYGPYVQLGEVEPGSKVKTPTSSLLASMSLDTVTLDDALRLLSLPRVVGVDPADGVEITAQNGRYGPFIKKGTDSRSLEREEQLFTVTLAEALAILAEPKRGAGSARLRPHRCGNSAPIR